jgi:flagellar hook-basal body complex protein FliE
MIAPLGPHAGLGAVGPGDLLGSASASAAPAMNGADRPGSSFLDALGEALAGLNDQLTAADAAAADFAAGGSTDLHDVILALSEAQLGLRLGVAVRDRLLEAYQDVMRLQI